MIDVVFLLLIFFITVSQISQAQNDPVQLPELSGSADQEPTELTINIRDTGEIVVEGRVYTEEAFISLVTRVLADQGDDPSRVTVVIRADTRVLAGSVNDVVKSLGRLQISRVRMAVVQPD